ncbi:MAG: hypothetical protein ACOYX1_16705 [Acidobacteriota bacterium]
MKETNSPRLAKSPAHEPAAGVLLAAALLAIAAGAGAAAQLAAACFSGHAFWRLTRQDSARARLQCGFSLPLLQALSPGTVLLSCWLGLALAAVALREDGWLARLASLLTLVFPALLMTGARAYLAWLGHPWPLEGLA